MREFVELANARGYSDWEHTLFSAQVVANSSPNFSAKRRKQTNYLALNPYKRQTAKKARGQLITGERGDEILDKIAGAVKHHITEDN